jgi:TM2 domain-containing membrane protein YozV
MEEIEMEKKSMLGGLILSAILPGAGLLLVNKGGWFALYLCLYLIGLLFTFLMGIGLLVVIPVWFIAAIHTFVAIRSRNALSAATT